VCLFVWGAYVFPCLIERASKKFTMFLPTGIPVRATLSVTLREYVDPHLLTKGTPLSSPDRTKNRVIKQGDSLWLLAAQEYGDPTQWRAIADANHLANPRILEPGTEIVIPPLE
jgi:LysM repeat protein